MNSTRVVRCGPPAAAAAAAPATPAAPFPAAPSPPAAVQRASARAQTAQQNPRLSSIPCMTGITMRNIWFWCAHDGAYLGVAEWDVGAGFHQRVDAVA